LNPDLGMYRTYCVKWLRNMDWLVSCMRNLSVTSTVLENTSIGPWKLTKERIFLIRVLLPLKMRDLWSHLSLSFDVLIFSISLLFIHSSTISNVLRRSLY
jgi:hypothetical protein